jgi:hypothetical protein
VALVPPRSSVLPPGAGNEEPKKALKPDQKGAKKVRKEEAGRFEVAQGHVHAASIGRHGDDDGATVAALEEVQATRLLWSRPRRVRAV